MDLKPNNYNCNKDAIRSLTTNSDHEFDEQKYVENKKIIHY